MQETKDEAHEILEPAHDVKDAVPAELMTEFTDAVVNHIDQTEKDVIKLQQLLGAYAMRLRYYADAAGAENADAVCENLSLRIGDVLDWIGTRVRNVDDTEVPSTAGNQQAVGKFMAELQEELSSSKEMQDLYRYLKEVIDSYTNDGDPTYISLTAEDGAHYLIALCGSIMQRLAILLPGTAEGPAKAFRASTVGALSTAIMDAWGDFDDKGVKQVQSAELNERGKAFARNELSMYDALVNGEKVEPAMAAARVMQSLGKVHKTLG
jgi:hypothetical protein